MTSANLTFAKHLKQKKSNLLILLMNKASPVILPKSKSSDFGISMPPNITKYKGTFKLNHFGNIFF